MSTVFSFPPVADPKAKILILGSMPGVESLRQNQYYAHPRNAFWKIMMHLLGGAEDLSYKARAQFLRENRIALWDVLKSCYREGSLDSAIKEEAPNDFKTFFKKHPEITHVFFNGQKAEGSFRKHVMPDLENGRYIFTCLPSTSPANASYTYAQKRKAWAAILKLL